MVKENGFNAKERVRLLFSEFQEIEASLDVPKKKKNLEILEAESSAPNLWDNQERARKIMQELGDTKKELTEVEEISGEIRVLKELVDDGETPDEADIRRLEGAVKKLRTTAFLSGEYDKKNAIVSINAGQGGTEAMDWASMLMRMYFRYAEKKGWRTEVLDMSEGEEAGVKGVTFSVEGPYAYGHLKGESGIHRLVRQSPFNADKLRQTSFASVEVLPELTDVDLPDIEIKDADLEWQFFRSSGKGGQNVNKVSTAVRLIHTPTGIVVSAQTQRTQEQNRKIAMDLLKSRLWVLEKEKLASEKKGLKGDVKPASWGNQIRSYVLHPYKMVKDLRTEAETADTESFLDGDLDEFIEAQVLEKIV